MRRPDLERAGMLAGVIVWSMSNCLSLREPNQPQVPVLSEMTFVHE